MTSTRIASVAAVAALAIWAAKATAIGFAGGLDKSPAEGPLFFAGLLAFVVATVSLGAALTSGRPMWLRVSAAVMGPVVGIGIAMIVDAGVGAFESAGQERHWVWTEFNLWVIALGGLALAAVARRRHENQA